MLLGLCEGVWGGVGGLTTAGCWVRVWGGVGGVGGLTTAGCWVRVRGVLECARLSKDELEHHGGSRGCLTEKR